MQLVGAPQRRDLLEQTLLQRFLIGGRNALLAEPLDTLAQPTQPLENRAPASLGRMCGEDRLDGEPPDDVPDVFCAHPGGSRLRERLGHGSPSVPVARILLT